MTPASPVRARLLSIVKEKTSYFWRTPALSIKIWREPETCRSIELPREKHKGAGHRQRLRKRFSKYFKIARVFKVITAIDITISVE